MRTPAIVHLARRLLADLAELAALSLFVASLLLWAALLSGPST